jgi:hypothetical protein
MNLQIWESFVFVKKAVEIIFVFFSHADNFSYKCKKNMVKPLVEEMYRFDVLLLIKCKDRFPVSML